MPVLGGISRLPADELGSDHDSLSSAMKRMAGGKDEPVLPPLVQHIYPGGRDDLLALDFVDEEPVGHAEVDALASA